MAERGGVIGDVGDRAAVGLQADPGQRGVAGISVQQRGDGAVGQLRQVVALPVAPQRVALGVVVTGLQGQMRGLAHALFVGASDRAHRGHERTPGLWVTHPHVPEGDAVPGDLGGQRPGPDRM